MPRQVYFSLIILPNILQFLAQHLLLLFQGHYTTLLLISFLVYTLNFLIVSYLLHKWFVRGKGGVRAKIIYRIREVKSRARQLKNYFEEGSIGQLVKIYCYMVGGHLIYRVVPGYVITILGCLAIDFYSQVTALLEERNILYINDVKVAVRRKISDWKQRVPRAKPTNFI